MPEEKTICIALNLFERGEGIDLGNGFFVTLTRGILARDLVKRRPGAIKMIRWGWLVITTMVTSFSRRLECYISEMPSLDSILNVFVHFHFTSLSKQRWPFCSVSYSCSRSPMGPPLAGTLDNVRGKSEQYFDIFYSYIYMDKKKGGHPMLIRWKTWTPVLRVRLSNNSILLIP